MLDAQIGRRHCQLAQNWNELTGPQLLQVCLAHGTPFDNPGLLYRELLKVLFQVPTRTIRKLNTIQFVELKPLVRFLKEPMEHAPLTKQLLPHLPVLSWEQIGRSRLFGPRESFRNLTFVEFIFADRYFLLYLQTQEVKWLHHLVAVLYRPQRDKYDPLAVTFGGDRREDFNEHLVSARAEWLAGVPHHVHYAVLLWWRGCRRELERRYARVFSAENNQAAASGGWEQVLLTLADGVHRIDATSHQLLHNVMREMHRVLEQHDRAQPQ